MDFCSPIYTLVDYEPHGLDDIISLEQCQFYEEDKHKEEIRQIEWMLEMERLIREVLGKEHWWARVADGARDIICDRERREHQVRFTGDLWWMVRRKDYQEREYEILRRAVKRSLERAKVGKEGKEVMPDTDKKDVSREDEGNIRLSNRGGVASKNTNGKILNKMVLNFVLDME